MIREILSYQSILQNMQLYIINIVAEIVKFTDNLCLFVFTLNDKRNCIISKKYITKYATM